MHKKNIIFGFLRTFFCQMHQDTFVWFKGQIEFRFKCKTCAFCILCNERELDGSFQTKGWINSFTVRTINLGKRKTTFRL